MPSRILPLLVTVLTVMDLSAQAASWEKLPALPMSLGNFACGTMGNDIVIAGGTKWEGDTKIWLDKIWRFDTRKKAWREAGQLPHALAYPSYGESAQGIYFSGGGDGNASRPESGWLDHQLVFHRMGDVPHPLVYSASAVAEGKLYVVAGATEAGNLNTATNLFYSVDLKTGKVEERESFLGGKCILSEGVALGGRIYVFTGAFFDATNQQPVNIDSCFVYSTANEKWSRIKSFPFRVRGLAGCVLDDRHILLAGGYKQDFTDEALVYDTKTDSYFQTAPLPYRAMVRLVKLGSELYCIGGEDRMRHRSNLFYRIAGKALLKEEN